MKERRVLAGAFVRTLVLHQVLRRRWLIDLWQKWNVQRLRRHAVHNVAFYRPFEKTPFEAFPIVGKSDVMASFEAFNCPGFSAPQVWDMIETGAAPPGYDVGCSTGTSGNRGLYLVSDAERFRWLGTILAKAVPDVLWTRHRVAVLLPRMSRLYAAANESRLVKLLFLDLAQGLDQLAGPLSEFAPTVIVAPPAALRWIADTKLAVRPSHVFSGAEVLDPMDRKAIEVYFGVTVREIYMATEGLFGVSCKHGTLHLAEDAVHFECEPFGDDPLLATLIVTDFTRRTQVLARYRMNDLVRLKTAPCPCGSAFRAVEDVIGRCDDVFWLPRRAGEEDVQITPDVLRNAVLGADRSIEDFRVYQTGANHIDLVLPPQILQSAADAALFDLERACEIAGAAPSITLKRGIISAPPGRKLRRVEKKWNGTAR